MSTSKPITEHDVTDAELCAGANGIEYRVHQMVHAAICPIPEMGQWSTVLRNAQVESVLVNARALAVILIEEVKSKPKKAEVSDAPDWLPNLVARHYLSGFCPKEKELLNEVKELTSKHLAHAVTPDAKLDPPGEWALKDLAFFITDQFAYFAEELAKNKSDRAACFNLAEVTQVGALNKKLREYRQKALTSSPQGEGYWRSVALRLLVS